MAHTTVKISQLPSASHSDITSATAVLPIIDGNVTKQITVDDLFGTATHITASGNISGSATSTGSFGLLRASNIGGNSPLIISDVTEITTFGTSSLELRGNPRIHGDLNILSQSFIYDAEDNQIIGSNDIQGAAGLITFGGGGARTLVQGLNIQLGASATQHVTASGNISASGVITAEGLVISDDASITDNLTVGSLSNGRVIFAGSSGVLQDDSNFTFNSAADELTVTKIANVNSSTHVTASGNISASGDITAKNLTLSGDATINGNLTFGNSTSDSVAFGAEISSSIIPDANNAYALGSPTRRWSSVFANSSSFNYISASTIDVNANTIRIGGTAFSKTDLDDLKAGKSISTSATKQVVHGGDDSTFVQMKPNAPGRVIHKVSNVSLFDMQTSSFAIGDPAGNVPIFLQAKNLSLSGSTTVSGSFTVTDLLTVLANYGQTGSFSVSGSTTLDGDVNADGAVTVTDLLTVLGGFGVSGSCAVSGALEISGSLAAGSPPALVITGSTSTTGSFDIGGNTTITGSFEQSGSSTFTGGGFVVNDLLNLLANFGNSGLPTGSGAGNVSAGDINLDGQVNVNDLLLLLAGYGNPSLLSTNLTIPPNTNYQLIGPQITVSQSIVVTVGSSSFFQIT